MRQSLRSSNLVRRYGRADAVNGLSLEVQPGRCYGFFGRNGAGKTTTIKCLLNLLRQTSGEVRVFGLDPAREEVAVKSRLAYVPDAVAFYPWMTVRDTLDYFAAFRSQWNQKTERALLDQFRLDVRQKTSHLSKGPAHAAGADHGHLPGARAAGAGRADVRASIRLSGASSSRRSSAPIRKATRGAERCSSPPT